MCAGDGRKVSKKLSSYVLQSATKYANSIAESERNIIGLNIENVLREMVVRESWSASCEGDVLSSILIDP